MGIRVATLNVWALPANISRHDEQRMAAISAEVARLSPDLLAYQEVWTETSRDTLVAGALAAGLDSIWHPEQATGESGLMIASRFPIRAIHFETFDARGHPERLRHFDYWGGKGFVAAEIETPEGPLAFVNTHLHANYAPAGGPGLYQGVRTAQLIQLAARLRSHADAPVIAVGDFNLLESERNYDIWLGLTGLVDVAAALDRRQTTTRTKNPYRRPGRMGKRIDYVTQRPGAGRRWTPTRIERVFDAPLRFDGEAGNYSDHAGLIADFRFERADGLVPSLRPESAAIEAARAQLARSRTVSLGRRRSQRIHAGVGAGAAIAAAATLKKVHATRRRFLRGSLAALTGMGCGLTLGHLWLSEWMHPEELAAFDAASARLERLAMGHEAT